MKMCFTLVLLAGVTCLAETQSNSGQVAKRIPLESVYTSGDQEGTKGLLESVRNSVKLNFGPQVSGPPVIFMINSPDFLDVLDKSNQLFKLSRENKPSKYPAEIKGSEKQWVVAYMGSNGSGPVYIVKSIEIENKKVRVAFEFLRDSVLADLHSYVVWVPIENLPPDEYQLELYDAGAKKVVATGKCKVTKD